MQHFFIIGAQRSGTTLLYQMLDQHPQIEMAKPLRPEPKYFIQKNLESLNKSAYQKLYFPAISNETKCLGEKSTSYYEFPHIAQKIKEFDNKCKILIILRDPVERAISNYFFTKNFGLENRSLEEVFLEKKEPPTLDKEISVNPFDYLKRGHYAELIEPYLQVFKKQLKVIQFEELNKYPDKVLNDIFYFLECNPYSSYHNSLEKVNAAKRGEISSKVITCLSEYYSSKNNILANLTDINVSYWR